MFRERPSTTPKVSHLTLTPSAATAASADLHNASAAWNVAVVHPLGDAPAEAAITAAAAATTPLSILTAASLSGAARTATPQTGPFVDTVDNAEQAIASALSPVHLAPDGPVHLSKAERRRLFRTDEVRVCALARSGRRLKSPV